MQVSTRILALSAAVLALSAGVPGYAQESQQTELQSWRVPGWSFTPGFAIGPVFDDNVAIAGRDEFGNTASDTLLEVEPFGQLEFFSARTTFSSGYRGSLRRYFELSNLDGVEHRLYASLRHRLTRRVTLFVDQSFQQSPTTDALELNGLPFVRVGSRYSLASAGIEARLTKSLDLATQYEMTYADFLSEDTPLRGGFVQGGYTSLTHRLGERASVGGEYSLRLADLNDGATQYTFQSVGSVFQYRTGEYTTLHLSGGMTHVAERSRDVTRSGPYWKAELVHRLERATVGAGYERSYTPSFALGGTQRSHQLRGYVEMPFRRNRLYVQESASWRRTDPFISDEPALDSMWIRSTLGYAIRRWLRLEGHHTFTSQDNRLAGGRVTRHVAGIQMVVSEPMRIR